MSVSEGADDRYRIDPGKSRFTVHGVADGLLSMFGHNPVIAIRGFGGDARFNSETLEGGSLLMLVQAGSLAVQNKLKEKDRQEMERAMREQVLNISTYPEIVFMSNNISVTASGQGRYRARISGNLTLRGVSRTETVDAHLNLDNGGLRASGEFVLRQTDYSIKPVSVAGGTLKLKDELKFSFDIFAGRTS